MKYFKCNNCNTVYTSIDLSRDLIEGNSRKFFMLTHCPNCYNNLVEIHEQDYYNSIEDLEK